jgi:hypothetical protein
LAPLQGCLMIEDRQTADYFDQFTPHFSQAKFQFALD